MGVIAVLPESVSSKIAAGEVIERPASVVKELVENAVDAQADRIEVQLEDGGKKLIRVVDNGVGMAPEDLEVAFVSHATSKLKTGKDLFAISTMGFRGEALWSIAAIAQARIVSRLRGEQAGAETEARGGAIGSVRECGAAEGTVIEVRNLFFNTPVRRKFLRTNTTEMSHVTETITRVALSSPGVHFTLTHNGKRVLNLPACDKLRDRAALFFGREIADALLEVELRDERLSVAGLVGPPVHARSNTKAQYTFINQRYVRDSAIFHAISQAYQGLLPAKRYPVLFLFLEMDPGDVDVNVHPTKIEVRFRHSHQVHSQVLAAVTQALRQADLVRSVQMPDAASAGSSFPPPTAPKHERREAIKQSLTEFFERQSRGGQQQKAFTFDRSIPTQQPSPPSQRSESFAAQPLERPRAFIQLHGSYIVEEADDGIRVIDQHALHERLLFDELKEKRQTQSLVKQPLLVPQMIELSPAEFFKVMSLKDDLASLGIDIEEFGRSSVVVRAVPQQLSDCDPVELVKDVLAELEQEEAGQAGDSPADVILKVMACKAAVKAGQRLSPQEISALLDKRDAEERTSTCPHGRPSTLMFSLPELEKQFGRR